jgi:LacI family transcriptional regulator
MSSQISPALTTIHVPSAEMGENAAEYLVAQIRQEPFVQPAEIETRLMVRETTAKPPVD